MSEETKELLRAMGRYFDLDPKSVNFWIRQTEMSNKTKSRVKDVTR